MLFSRKIVVTIMTLVVPAAVASVAIAETDFAPYVTTPMDQSGLGWYEQGLNTAAPTSGLPHAGVISAQDDPSSTFLLQPYTGNNVLFLTQNTQFGQAAVSSGTMTLSTP